MAARAEPLSAHEVRVFYAWSAELAADGAAEHCRALLSDDERARERRFRFSEDQQVYLLAHALTRSVLGELCGAAPPALRFENGPHGRPELVLPSAAPRLRFNLSHTRGLVACAVALEHDVGVDVEHVDRRVERDQLAASVFSAREREALARLDAEAKRARFFELWTLKEAYIKAVGKGLALPLRAITLEPDVLPGPRIAFEPPVDDDPQSWSLHVTKLGAAHALAVALNAAQPVRLSLQSRWP